MNDLNREIGWRSSGVSLPYDYRRLMENPQTYMADGGRVVTVYMKYSDGRTQPYERLHIAFVWSGKGDPDHRSLKNIIQEAIIATESFSRQQKTDISDSSLLDVVLWSKDEIVAYALGHGLHSVKYLLCPDGSFVAPDVLAAYTGNNVQKLNQNNPSMLAVLMNYFGGGSSISETESAINHMPAEELFRIYLLALGITTDPQSIVDALETSKELAVRGRVQTYHAKAQVDYQSGQLVVVPLELEADKFFRSNHLIGAEVMLQVNTTEEKNEKPKTKPKPKPAEFRIMGDGNIIAQSSGFTVEATSGANIQIGELVTKKDGQFYPTSINITGTVKAIEEAIEEFHQSAVKNLQRGKKGQEGSEAQVPPKPTE